MKAAAEIARQMRATARFEPPPEADADAWVWGVYDEEDASGRVVARGLSIWHRKDLSDEWHRLRFAETDES
jgi:hypothetical protein